MFVRYTKLGNKTKIHEKRFLPIFMHFFNNLSIIFKIRYNLCFFRFKTTNKLLSKVN